MVVQAYESPHSSIKRTGHASWQIERGYVPNMKVPAHFYVNDALRLLLFDEVKQYHSNADGKVRGFLPAIQQLANVSTLPGIVGQAIGLPDIHAGYGFAVGSCAAIDVAHPEAVVTPGGIGFDINCGVRVIRTNLTEADVTPVKEQLVQAIFNHIPVGVGSRGIIPIDMNALEDSLFYGIDWSIREGYSWPEDKEHCEEYGRMLQADPSAVSSRAKKRGLPQLGTLGAGNHYCEVQVVDEIFDHKAAEAMGITGIGQVVVMVHSGSRGLGHQVATDALMQMESVMGKQNITVPDPQLACAHIDSPEGQHYLKGMSAAANYAWVNRSSMTFLVRQAFASIFKRTPEDLDMHVIYDVCHNIAKFEQHLVNGQPRELLVHRKGATRAFPPNHPSVPVAYQYSGQPVLIGGTMGTYSYILTGTHKGFQSTFGTTCHGAGRALSRNKSRSTIAYEDVVKQLSDKNISIRVASPKLIMEEAPEAYKNVCDVVQTCDDVNISKKAVKLRPIGVIKG